LISVNRLTYEIIKKIQVKPDYYRVEISKLPSGSTVIDAGIEAPGGYDAGLLTTEIAMGGAGKAQLGFADYDGLQLPTVIVSTDHPGISLFGAQLAGWRVKAGDYQADGSGPARALALRPKNVFEKIKYKDEADVAVILLETEEKPPDEAALYIADRCNVKPENVYIVLTSTTSMSGMLQISGRVVEVGFFRLDLLGFDLTKVKYASGYAPIMPLHPDMGRAMGRAEDAITYGGIVNYVVDEDEEVVKEIINKASSLAAPDYGRPSYDIYKSVDFDFTKIDPAIFAPAMVTITCSRTGGSFTAGEINYGLIHSSVKD
jgi:methenyltetrahydromethanopterin cyclohydrolase